VRQGQQNRRGRGRNNNSNRKGGGHHHNPLSRSFESNGPDVKIRGTPAHIAEKYIALARDAQSSGDPVLAENYLQHAEHYSRIIMAYRDQLGQQGEGLNGNGQRVREAGEGGDDFGDDEGDDAGGDDFPQVPQMPVQQQPAQSFQPQRQNEGGQNRSDRPFRRDQGRNRDRYNDRGGDRGGDRDRQEARRPPTDRPPQQEQGEGGGEIRRPERFAQQPQHEQPEFLRRPVRRARPENGESKDEPTTD